MHNEIIRLLRHRHHGKHSAYNYITMENINETVTAKTNSYKKVIVKKTPPCTATVFNHSYEFRTL